MNPLVRSSAEVEADRREAAAREERAERERAEKEKDDEEQARIKAAGGLMGRHRVAPAAAGGAPTSAALAAAVTVGDGGAGWRAKALKRARERADLEGKSVGEVVRGRMGVLGEMEERWGREGGTQSRSSAPSHNRNRPPPPAGASAGAGGSRDTDMTSESGFPASFGHQRRQQAHPNASDPDTSMDIVETEEEEEARLKAQANAAAATAAAAAAARKPPSELSRLMKRPGSLPPSGAPMGSPPPASAPSSSSSAAGASSATSSWREKLKKNLTGSAAPGTPEGEVGRMYSTPTAAQMTTSREHGRSANPSPSPLPSMTPSSSASPSPTPHHQQQLQYPSQTQQDVHRFAGMTHPSNLGMDKALNVILEERPSPADSPTSIEAMSTEGEHALPQFAAAFLPLNAAASPPPTAPATSTPHTPSATPSLPTGASAAELNQLSAQAQVAKLKKNTKLYDELQAKIARLKAENAAAAAAVAAPAASSQRTGVVAGLPSSLSIEDKLHLLRSEGSTGGGGAQRDEFGREIVVLMDPRGRPAAAAAAAAGPVRDPTMKNKKLAPNITAGTGERVAYFADDVQGQTLHELVAKEKLARQSQSLGLNEKEYHDLDRDHAQSILRDSAYKHQTTDEQYDETDFDMRRYDRTTSLKNQKRSTHDQEQRARAHQIGQLHKQESLVDKCWYCLGGGSSGGGGGGDVAKSLLLSIGVRCYLSIPRVNWITPGHCLIVPIDHTLSQTQMEDDVYEEVAYFKRHLEKMYASWTPPCKPVFLETVHDLQRKRHTVIECIPLTEEQWADAEVFIVKGLQEADEEWSQHKKIIRFQSAAASSSSSSKGVGGGVRHAIPKNFAYFSIEFGTRGGGIVHQIEDREKFSENFGKEILLEGVLGEPAAFLLRGKRAGATEEAKRVRDFQATWKKFDWTQRLTANQPQQQAPPPAASAATCR